MNRANERKQITYVLKRLVLAVLVVVSFILTSNTFAYWADVITGTNTSVTSTFSVGPFTFNGPEFTLDDSNNSYSYLIPLDDLLDDPESNIDNVLFGIIWNDESMFDQFDNQDVSADIEVSYEILITQNGNEVNRNTYRRYSPLINLEINEDNPDTINFNDSAETFEFDVSINHTYFYYKYVLLARYDVSIVVTYTINYDSVTVND